MTETDFRIKHSTLIEYYQYIEMHLKGICASMLSNEEKNWFERLEDYDADPLGKLVKIIHQIQSQNNMELFAADDFKDLEEIRIARNYWVHQCFAGSPHVIFRNGSLRNPNHGIKLINDLNNAMDFNEKTAEKFRFLHQNIK